MDWTDQTEECVKCFACVRISKKKEAFESKLLHRSHGFTYGRAVSARKSPLGPLRARGSEVVVFMVFVERKGKSGGEGNAVPRPTGDASIRYLGILSSYYVLM